MFSPHRHQKTPEELARQRRKAWRAVAGLGALAAGAAAAAAPVARVAAATPTHDEQIAAFQAAIARNFRPAPPTTPVTSPPPVNPTQTNPYIGQIPATSQPLPMVIGPSYAQYGYNMTIPDDQRGGWGQYPIQSAGVAGANYYGTALDPRWPSNWDLLRALSWTGPANSQNISTIASMLGNLPHPINRSMPPTKTSQPTEAPPATPPPPVTPPPTASPAEQPGGNAFEGMTTEQLLTLFPLSSEYNQAMASNLIKFLPNSWTPDLDDPTTKAIFDQWLQNNANSPTNAVDQAEAGQTATPPPVTPQPPPPPVNPPPATPPVAPQAPAGQTDAQGRPLGVVGNRYIWGYLDNGTPVWSLL